MLDARDLRKLQEAVETDLRMSIGNYAALINKGQDAYREGGHLSIVSCINVLLQISQEVDKYV